MFLLLFLYCLRGGFGGSEVGPVELFGGGEMGGTGVESVVCSPACVSFSFCVAAMRTPVDLTRGSPTPPE